MSAPTTAEVREDAAALRDYAKGLRVVDHGDDALLLDGAAERIDALAEHRDALAAEVARLSVELSCVAERCDWEPDTSPKWSETGDEREPSDRVEDLVDALRAARVEVAQLRKALEASKAQELGCVRAYAHDCQCPKCSALAPHGTRGWTP